MISDEMLLNKLTKIEVTLAEQHLTLKEHMRRTQNNEDFIKAVEQRVIPLENHVIKSAWLSATLGKVLAVLVSVGSIASAGMAIYKFFF